jgi:hypothetical protein
MPLSFEDLFCLSCGEPMSEPLRRAASLRCLDCREAAAPISFELAIRARDLIREQMALTVRNRPAAA